MIRLFVTHPNGGPPASLTPAQQLALHAELRRNPNLTAGRIRQTTGQQIIAEHVIVTDQALFERFSR